MTEYAVIIVGSGPAGCATALALHRLAPNLTPHVLILEKARHPRHKLCGGGITPYADQVLADLGVSVDVPSYPVDRVRFTALGVSSEIRRRNILRIVRRDRFDAALAAEVRARGFALHEEEPVQEVWRENEVVAVRTPRAVYRAPIVVAADGARSLIRRKLVGQAPSRLSRLVEVLVPDVNVPKATVCADYTAVFDFSPAVQGLQGYVWLFPTTVSGQRAINMGVFDSRVHPRRSRPNLKQVLAEALKQWGGSPDVNGLMGHPERWFHPDGPFSAPNVLLVGDAAGVEPLAGEGISAALDYGLVAAPAILDALKREDFSFADYRLRVLRSRVGKSLWRKSIAARLIYRIPWPWAWRLGIRLVGPVLSAFVRVPDRPDPAGSLRRLSIS